MRDLQPYTILPEYIGMPNDACVQIEPDGFTFLFLRKSITPQETEEFIATGLIEVKLFAWHAIFFLLKFNDREWVRAPCFSLDAINALQPPQKDGYNFQIALVDTNTGYVVSTLTIFLSLSFAQKIRGALRKHSGLLSNTNVYMRIVRFLQEKLSSEQMAEAALLRYLAQQIMKEQMHKGPTLHYTLLNESKIHTWKTYIPTELMPFVTHIPRAGKYINCIPASLLADALADGNLETYILPMPVNYVIKHGYRISNDNTYVICDVTREDVSNLAPNTFAEDGYER